jgi:hypothetical protein
MQGKAFSSAARIYFHVFTSYFFVKPRRELSFVLIRTLLHKQQRKQFAALSNFNYKSAQFATGINDIKQKKSTIDDFQSR